MNFRIPALVLLLAATGGASADDWPQWRGPNRNGISKETGLLKSWPKGGPKLLWTFKDAGIGFSSFAVVGDKLYTLGTRGKDEVVLALDIAKNGAELWTAKIGPISKSSGSAWGEGPRATPTLDGKLLFALGGQGDLVCLDISDAGKAKEVWRKNLETDFGGEMMTEWGYSESPLVDGDLLVCTPGGDDGTIVAMKKTDGKLVWRSKQLKNKAPYSSIVAADIHGVRQYIQNSYVDETVGGYISGIAAKDGKVLWSMPTFKGHSYAVVPTPIVKDNLVYMTSGYGAGCHCFEISKDMKATDLYSKDKWKAFKNTHGGVVLLGDHIYGHSEGIGWACQELKTGNIVWDDRNTLKTRSGAVTSAEGMLYCLTEEEGEVALVAANTKGFQPISTFKIPELSQLRGKLPTSRSAKVWAHPVVANGRLYLRDYEFIWCYDIKAK